MIVAWSNGMPQKSIAVELLRKLLKDGIRVQVKRISTPHLNPLT